MSQTLHDMSVVYKAPLGEHWLGNLIFFSFISLVRKPAIKRAKSTLKSGKKKAHKLKKSPGHWPGVPETPGVTTGVYVPVSQELPVGCCRKADRKGHFPGTPGRPGGFQKFYVSFSYAPLLLPIKHRDPSV